MLSGIGLPTIYLESNVHSAHLFQLCAACGRGETNKLKNLAHVLKHVDPVSRIHNTFIHMYDCTCPPAEFYEPARILACICARTRTRGYGFTLK